MTESEENREVIRDYQHTKTNVNMKIILEQTFKQQRKKFNIKAK